MGLFNNCAGLAPQIGIVGKATAASHTLNSRYQHLVSGRAIGFRYISPVSDYLSDLYILQLAAVGSPTVHNLTINQCDIDVANTLKPGTPVASYPNPSATPWVVAGSCPIWLKASWAPGARPIVVEGTTYWIVVGNDQGGSDEATVYPTIAFYGVAKTIGEQNRGRILGFTTTDQATWTAASYITNAVLKFANGTIIGFPWNDNNYTIPSNSYEKGLYLPALTESLKINLLRFNSGGSKTNWTGFKIYKAETASGGTPEYSHAFSTYEKLSDYDTFHLTSEFTLLKGQAYRIIIYGSGSFAIEKFTVTDLDSAYLSDFSVCTPITGMKYTEWDGSQWVDSPQYLPRMALIISDQVAVIPVPTIGPQIMMIQPPMEIYQ